jgi:hypothetical protein
MTQATVHPYAAAMAAVNPLKDRVEISAHGRAGFGNQFFRVRYAQDNLISKVTLRHDLVKLGAASEAMSQYREAIEGDKQFPWTVLPADFELPAIPMVFQLKPEEYLDESFEVAQSVFTALQGYSRTNAYLRQWKASSKGVGCELILVLEEGEQFAVLEMSLNFYRLTQSQLMMKQLQAIVNKPKETVAE